MPRKKVSEISLKEFLMVKSKLLEKGITLAGVARMCSTSKVYARRAAKGEFHTSKGDAVRDTILRIIDDRKYKPYRLIPRSNGK